MNDPRPIREAVGAKTQYVPEEFFEITYPNHPLDR